MKIKFACLFSVLVLGIGYVAGQPVLNSDYNPIFGDTYVYKTVAPTDTVFMQPGQPGQGVVWNLTAMHGQLSTQQYNWKYPLNTPYYSAFPAANIAAEVVNVQIGTWFEYYNYSNTDFKIVGTFVSAATTQYGNGYKLLSYPLSYSQSCTDFIVDTGLAIITVNVNTTYDGHGTLQLEGSSGGNFNNVARVKVVENIVYNYGPGLSDVYNIVTYYWYDNTTSNLKKQPIAIIRIKDVTDYNGNFTHEKTALIRQILFINSTPALSFNNSNVNLYPNPFTDKVNLSMPAIGSQILIQISDLTGRIVKEIRLEKSIPGREEVLWLNDIRQGVYLAKITTERGTVIQRITKE